ncbi:hypothetical protein HMPREF1318_1371 [Actinomyces massiliensis F0489]|uniref:Uncharacterized protein n=1 Tax=Actinomyces massiliensis F0489 TaxID=1125718 RepID=J0XFC2_9ACTO|nr:hypothetical protein HMPREF1318_1371 [Actinomyces massiliensis F0489]
MVRAGPRAPRHGRRSTASIRAILGHRRRDAKNEAAHIRRIGHIGNTAHMPWGRRRSQKATRRHEGPSRVRGA